MKIIAKNKKAYFDYEILETFEAGIVLVGTEIKSIRKGSVQLKDSYISIRKNEMFLKGAHISEYEFGNINNHDPRRDRKLLMHKKEILKIAHKIKIEGLTLVPTKIYFKGQYVKIEVGMARGKKRHDKREALKRKDQERAIQKTLKQY